MAEQKHFLDYSGTDELWKRIVKLCNKKLEKVENADDSIVVKDNRKVAVRISESEGNLLQLKSGEGLYVKAPVNHKLTFGAEEEYVYDGSEDITVPVYMGQINH